MFLVSDSFRRLSDSPARGDCRGRRGPATCPFRPAVGRAIARRTPAPRANWPLPSFGNDCQSNALLNWSGAKANSAQHAGDRSAGDIPRGQQYAGAGIGRVLPFSRRRLPFEPPAQHAANEDRHRLLDWQIHAHRERQRRNAGQFEHDRDQDADDDQPPRQSCFRMPSMMIAISWVLGAANFLSTACRRRARKAGR